MENSTAAFDSISASYDREFSLTPLGRMLRQRVWQHLAKSFASCGHLLELACGTGEDAIWLQKEGFRLTATDGSQSMVKITRRKAAVAGIDLKVRRFTLQQITEGELDGELFDGCFSNFGGLNTLSSRSRLAQSVSRLLTPDARFVVVLMGPWCPWEIGWYLFHGQTGKAFRRIGPGTKRASVGGCEFSVSYPTAHRLRREFSPWFRYESTRSLGLWLPPTYLGHLVKQWPRLAGMLDTLERKTAGLTGSLGDHYICTFRMDSVSGKR